MGTSDPDMKAMTLERFLGVFVEAFCRGKSVYHPYVARRAEGLWILEDGPGRRQPRKTEVIAAGMAPAEVIGNIRRARAGWHFLCHALDESESPNADAVRREYRRLGYRAMSTEWLFVHDLVAIPEFECRPPVRQIESAEQLAAMYSGQGRRRCWRDDARLYGIWDETTDYGWVYSTPIHRDAFVSDLFVGEECRRCGYGRALMSRLLHDDRRAGIEFSVLLASKSGARLYPLLGYRPFGVLQVFCPVRDGR